MRSPAELTEAFRAQGWKVTPQRQLLFRLLHDNPSHPSVDALFQVASAQMPGISLRTVYQTVTDLVAMGELRQLLLGGGAHRVDPNVDEHHHLVCDGCGDVRDLYVDDVLARLGTTADLDGFQADRAALVLHGTCAACAAASHAISPNHSTKEHP